MSLNKCSWLLALTASAALAMKCGPVAARDIVTAEQAALPPSDVPVALAEKRKPTTERAYSIEDYLANEEIGETLILDDHRVLFEHARARADASQFRHAGVIDYPLYGNQQILLFDLRSGRPARPLFAQDTALHYAVSDLSPDRALLLYRKSLPDRVVLGAYSFATGRTTELEAALDSRFQPIWVSASKMLFAELPASRTASSFIDTMYAAWTTMRAGKQATASQIGSGRFSHAESEGRDLLVADMVTGKVVRLARGDFTDRALAPGSTWLAAVRRLNQVSTPGANALEIPDSRAPLSLIDLQTGREVSICAQCDVFPGSLSWSPSGNRLAFIARRTGAAWQTARLWSYRAGETAASQAPGLAEAQAVARDVEGDLRAQAISWRGDEPVLGGPNRASTPTAAAPAGSRLLALAPAFGLSVYLEKPRSAGRLVVASATARHVVMPVNPHLAGVTGGQPFHLRYTRPDGTPGEAWVLMPPGWRPQDGPLPTIVEVYPGRVGKRLANNADRGLSSTTANLYPLATHGYAVLFPGLPLSPTFPRDTIPGLAAQVDLAIEKAVAAGYVDPDRLAVQGRSYGAFGTLGIIAQTKRYKAAVAIAGLYDQFSKYGLTRISTRFQWEQSWPITQGSSRVETSQEAMGAPPWKDPERYLRNSPIMQVEAITTPVMLIHGDLDDTISVEQAERMFNALYRTGKDALLVRYWGEGHGVPTSPANVRDMWARLFKWYDMHLGPPFDVRAALTRNATQRPAAK